MPGPVEEKRQADQVVGELIGEAAKDYSEGRREGGLVRPPKTAQNDRRERADVAMTS